MKTFLSYFLFLYLFLTEIKAINLYPDSMHEQRIKSLSEIGDDFQYFFLHFISASCQHASEEKKFIHVKEQNTKEIVLKGLLNRIYFYGRYNYGETPEEDEIEKSYIVSLHQPIKLEHLSPEDGATPLFNQACLLHIYSGSSRNLIKEEFIGKNVEIKAKSFFPAFSGHHNAPVVSEILSIKILDRNF